VCECLIREWHPYLITRIALLELINGDAMQRAVVLLEGRRHL
jgi:hypothetical protein